MLEFWQEIQYLHILPTPVEILLPTLKNVAFRQLAQYTAVMLALLTSGVVNVAPASSQALLPFVSQQDRKDFAREAERLYKSALNLSQFQQYPEQFWPTNLPLSAPISCCC
jgi:predicted solute-binding protein